MVAQIDRDYLQVARSRTWVRLLSYGVYEGRPATTRGRWFNPVVARYLRSALECVVTSVPDRPIFLIGVGRSGTTLLGRLLSVHPDVGFLNEPKAMWHLIDPMEDVSGFYNRSKLATMRRSSDDVTAEMRDRARALYSHYQRVTRSKRVVDKYCELSYRRDYLRALFPDCVLAAIVRRPGAVAKSIEEWSATHGSATEDWWGVHDRKWEVMCASLVANQPDADLLLSFARAARGNADRALIEWIVGMRELTRELPGAELDLVVRYEDLVAAPVTEMDRVQAVLGLRHAGQVEQMALRAVHADLGAAGRDFPIPEGLAPAIDDLLMALGYA